MKPQITFNGRLEIKFDSIPSSQLRGGLKDRGFQWDSIKRVWHLARPVNLRFVRNEPITQDGFQWALSFCVDYLGLSLADGKQLLDASQKAKDCGPDYFDMAVEDRMAEACGL